MRQRSHGKQSNSSHSYRVFSVSKWSWQPLGEKQYAVVNGILTHIAKEGKLTINNWIWNQKGIFIQVSVSDYWPTESLKWKIQTPEISSCRTTMESSGRVRTLRACYHLSCRNWFLNNSSFFEIFYSLLQKIHKHAA